MNSSEYLVHLANLGLVLQEDWRIEVRNLLDGAPTNQVTFTRVKKLAQFCTGIGEGSVCVTVIALRSFELTWRQPSTLHACDLCMCSRWRYAHTYTNCKLCDQPIVLPVSSTCCSIHRAHARLNSTTGNESSDPSAAARALVSLSASKTNGSAA